MTNHLDVAFLVAGALFVKHNIADFYLQTPYMLGKGKSGTAWIMPLTAHCLVHIVFTLGIFLLYRPHLAVAFAALEFVIHFIVDRIKAIYKAGPEGPWGSEKGTYLNKYYRAFGDDQMVHGLTYILLMILSNHF